MGQKICSNCGKAGQHIHPIKKQFICEEQEMINVVKMSKEKEVSNEINGICKKLNINPDNDDLTNLYYIDMKINEMDRIITSINHLKYLAGDFTRKN